MIPVLPHTAPLPLGEPEVVTAPSVSMFAAQMLAQTKEFCEYDASDRDTLFLTVLEDAYAKIEKTAALALFTQTLALQFDRQQGQLGVWYPPRDVLLPRSPVTSISSVALSYEGTETAVSTSKFFLRREGRKSRVMMKEGESWPGVRYDTVRFEYACGYGTTIMALPDTVVMAAMQYAASRFFERTGIVSGTTVTLLPTDWRTTLFDAGFIRHLPDAAKAKTGRL